MVPPGSRQVLSSDPSHPTTGYGENILGAAAESERVRLPDLSTIFARRAARLQALTPGHELEGFLRLIAALVTAQHIALAGLPPGSLPGPAEIAKAKLAKRAPLDPSTWPRDESWRGALARILETIDGDVLPEPARDARAALGKAGSGELEALADRFLGLFVRFFTLNFWNRDDTVWMKNLGAVINNKEEGLPELGKYNAGQKLVFWGQSILILLLLGSGFVLWDTYFASFTTIDQKRLSAVVHALCAIGAILIWIVHVYAAIWVKGTLRAMTRGSVTGGWAWKHHRKWFRQEVGKS